MTITLIHIVPSAKSSPASVNARNSHHRYRHYSVVHGNDAQNPEGIHGRQ
jgi:hypothetical protein